MFHWCRCGSAICVLTQVLDARFFGRGGEGGGGGWGGEVLKKRFVWRGSAPTSNTVLLYTTENRINSQ